MAEIEYIKHLYENEDKSLREIARITESDFRTVQKYAYQHGLAPAGCTRRKVSKDMVN